MTHLNDHARNLLAAARGVPAPVPPAGAVDAAPSDPEADPGTPEEATDTEATESGEAEAEGTDEQPPADLYDPAEHTVAQVLDYLDSVGEPEADRVLAAERAGKARVGILG